jgi:hypothetical protein
VFHRIDLKKTLLSIFYTLVAKYNGSPSWRMEIKVPVRAIRPIGGRISNDLIEGISRFEVDRRPRKRGNQKWLVDIGPHPAGRVAKTVSKDERISRIHQVDVIDLVLLFV